MDCSANVWRSRGTIMGELVISHQDEEVFYIEKTCCWSVMAPAPHSMRATEAAVCGAIKDVQKCPGDSPAGNGNAATK